MENFKNILVLVLVAILLVVGTLYLTNSGGPVVTSSGIGAPSGAAHWQVESFLQGLAAGARDQFSISNLGAPTIAATTTINTSGANCDYLNISGVDYADCQISFTATSSVPATIPNPFGAATSSLLSAIVDITSGITGAATYDLATSTAANQFVRSTSTPALLYARSVASTFIDRAIWLPRSASTTKMHSVLGIADAVLAQHDNENSSPFFLRPNEVLKVQIATSTPGTFGSYYEGTLSARFMKP